MNSRLKTPRKILIYIILAVLAFSLGAMAFISNTNYSMLEKAEAANLAPSGSPSTYRIKPSDLTRTGDSGAGYGRYQVNLTNYNSLTRGNANALDTGGSGDLNVYGDNFQFYKWNGASRWADIKIYLDPAFAKVSKKISFTADARCNGRADACGIWSGKTDKTSMNSKSNSGGVMTTDDVDIGYDQSFTVAMNVSANGLAWGQGGMDTRFYNLAVFIILPDNYLGVEIAKNATSTTTNKTSEQVVFTIRDNPLNWINNSYITIEEKYSYETTYRKVSDFNYSKSGTAITLRKTYYRDVSIKISINFTPFSWGNNKVFSLSDEYEIGGFYMNKLSVVKSGEQSGGNISHSYVGSRPNGFENNINNIIQNDTIKLSATTNNGYYFLGWYIGDDLISISKSFDHKVDVRGSVPSGGERKIEGKFAKIGEFEQIQHYRFNGNTFKINFDAGIVVSHSNPFVVIGVGDIKDNYTNNSKVKTYNYTLTIQRKNSAGSLEEVGRLSSNQIIIDPLLVYGTRESMSTQTMYNPTADWTGAHYKFTITTGDTANGTDGKILKTLNAFFQYSLDGGKTWIRIVNENLELNPDGNRAKYQTTQTFSASSLGTGAYKVLFNVGYLENGNFIEIGRTQSETKNSNKIYSYKDILFNAFLDVTEQGSTKLTISGHKIFDRFADEIEFYTNATNYAITLNLSGFSLSGALIEFQLIDKNGSTSPWQSLISGDGVYFSLINGAPRYNNVSGNAESSFNINGDYRLEFKQDYKYLIKFKVTAGNTTTPSLSNVAILNQDIAVYIDYSSPKNDTVEYPGIVALEGSQNGWVAETVSGDIIAKFTFTDGEIGSGVKEIRLHKNTGSINFNLNGTDIVGATSDLNIISKNGINTIEITIVDAEEYFIEIEDFIGNIKRMSVSQRVDIYTPSIKDISGYQSGEWTNNDVNLTFTVDCGPSGVEIGYQQGDKFIVFYQEQQPIIPTGIGTGEQIGHTINITIADPQNNEYKLIARSQAGLVSAEFPITIRIDKTEGSFVSKTELQQNQISEWQNTYIPIEMQIDDTGMIKSGIKSVIVHNNSKEVALIGVDGLYKFNIENPLNYKVVVTDYAGNSFETEYKARVNLVETIITVDAYVGNTSTTYDFNTWLNLADKTNGQGFVRVVFNIQMGGTPLILSYRKDNGNFVDFDKGEYLGLDGYDNNLISQTIVKEWLLEEEQNSNYDIMYTLKNSLVSATTPLNKLAGIDQYNLINIDTTPPEVVISYVNNENASITVDINKWVYYNIRADFDIKDVNGSGIDTNATLSVNGTPIGGIRYVFTDTNVYNIAIVDIAGNYYQTVVSPKIDKFDDFVLKVNTTLKEGFVADNEKWISKNVDFNFEFTNKEGTPISRLSNPSNFELLYSISKGGEYKSIHEINGRRQLVEYNMDNNGGKLAIVEDQSAEYRFILRTGAGRDFVFTTDRYWGVYKDSTKASLTFSAESQYMEYLSDWTYKDVNFTLTTSKSQSGVNVDYIVINEEIALQAKNMSDEELIEFYNNLFTTNTKIGITNGIQLNKYEFTLTVSKDCLADYYLFRITTGAGVTTYSSKMPEDTINQPFLVKIDTVIASFADYKSVDKNNAAYDGSKFTDGSVETFIYGAKGGPSGYKVIYYLLETEDYVTIFEFPAVSGSVTFEDDQDAEYMIAIISGAGMIGEYPPTNTYTAIPLSIKIDKVQAQFTYSINGTQLTENVTENNLNWYISTAVITFDLVGEDLLSGHFFEYTVSDDGINFNNDYITANIENQGTRRATLKISTNKNQPQYYKFRIRNGANVIGEIKDAKEIKVDVEEYVITTEQYIGNVLGANNEFGYILQIDKSAGFESHVEFTKYRRGDKIEVLLRTSPKIVATDTSNERLWNYFKSYQVIGTSINQVHNWDIDFNSPLIGNSVEFRGSELNFEVIDSDVRIVLNYVREVLIDFENIEQSIQNNTIQNVNIIYLEEMFEEKFAKSLGIILRYYYFDDAESTPFADIVNNRKIGKYRINVAYNNEDFHIKNLQSDSYSLNLKYFENIGSELFDDNFIVDGADAFNHIDFYMSNDPKYDYLKNDNGYQFYFRQTVDLQKDKLNKLVNPFTGYYDGENHEIVSKNTDITENIFTIIKGGTIKNLGVVYNLNIVREQEYIGMLAEQIVLGEDNRFTLIENVYVIGTLNVISLSKDKATYIGGLAGKSNSVTIKNTFVDVSIDQIKTNKNTSQVYIGGLIGYIDGNNGLINLYLLSTIAVYNLPNAKLGTVFGWSSPITNVSNVNILKNNLTFQNELVEKVTSLETAPFNGAFFVEFKYFNDLISQLIADGSYENKANKTVSSLSIRRIKETIKLNSGTGTAQDPIQISEERDLELLEKIPFANFVIVNDIILKDNFNRVYNYYKVFSGSLVANKSNGNNYFAIYNYNYITDSNNSSDIIGLIAYSVGKFENINLLDVVINVNDNYTKEEVTVGSLVGILFNGGEMTNAIVSGYITFNNRNVDAVVGGLVGKINSAKLTNIISLVNVNIENSKQLIAGGILGVANNGLLSNSELNRLYSLSKVSASYDDAGAVGNVVGYVMNPLIDLRNIFFINDNTFIGSMANNIFIGYNKSLNINNYRGYNYNEFINQREGSNIPIKDIVMDIYPFESGLGTAENPFVIVNEDQLSYISNYLYAHYKLGANIDLSNNFETIGKGAMFTGTLSGNKVSESEFVEYYSISNLRVPLIENNAGNLESFKLNVFVANGDEYYQSGGEYIFGSLAKYNYGYINTITLSGTVHISNPTTENVIVGGLVGIGYGGSIKACINGVDLKVNSVFGEVGGIIGRVEGNSIIEGNTNVEAEHGITASDIIVNGNIKAGLIVGLNRSAEAIIKRVELNNTVIINGIDKGEEHYIGYDLYDVLQ